MSEVLLIELREYEGSWKHTGEGVENANMADARKVSGLIVNFLF